MGGFRDTGGASSSAGGVGVEWVFPSLRLELVFLP